MFCESCGTQVQAGAKACVQCGQTRSGYSSEKRGRLERHVQMLGIFWIAYSAFTLLSGVVLLILANTLFGHFGRNEMNTPAFLQPLLSVVSVFVLVKATLGISAGVGLLRRQAWARVLTLVLGFLAIVNLPLGTALGIYTIWALLSPGADNEYTTLATA